MQRTILAILTLICGLALLSGCNSPTTSRAADEPKATHLNAAARDATVLQVVLDDMLSKDDSESPMEWHGDQSQPVYVSKNIPTWRMDANKILSRNDEKKWKALTNTQLDAVAEAADDLVARAETGASLPELKSTSGRVKIYEDAGPATQPTTDDPLGGERASSVYLPGYSKDGRYAVVWLSFPWSGNMHSGVVTYLLEHTDQGWKMLLRDFTYYV